MLPSFGQEPLEEVYLGISLIYRFKTVWIDQFVFKPHKSSRVKGRYDPADHAPGQAGMAPIPMIRQLNIEWAVPKARFLPSGTPGSARLMTAVVGARARFRLDTVPGNTTRNRVLKTAESWPQRLVSGAGVARLILRNVNHLTFAT